MIIFQVSAFSLRLVWIYILWGRFVLSHYEIRMYMDPAFSSHMDSVVKLVFIETGKVLSKI